MGVGDPRRLRRAGRVAGIGWMLALLADLVVAAEDGRWTHAFLRRGMAPHAGDPFFLPRVLPFHALNEIALLGDTVTSSDLYRWGAVNLARAGGVGRDGRRRPRRARSPRARP
ncbi:enoyl-CoA hydratase-related protein [Yinghuangia aomiensis]